MRDEKAGKNFHHGGHGEHGGERKGKGEQTMRFLRLVSTILGNSIYPVTSVIEWNKAAQGGSAGLPKQMGELNYAAPQHLNYYITPKDSHKDTKVRRSQRRKKEVFLSAILS
jgi:hypothetical protein